MDDVEDPELLKDVFFFKLQDLALFFTVVQYFRTQDVFLYWIYALVNLLQDLGRPVLKVLCKVYNRVEGVHLLVGHRGGQGLLVHLLHLGAVAVDYICNILDNKVE